MTKYRRKQINRIYKIAMLNLIKNTMKSKSVVFVPTDEGYDKKSDMIHFSSKGHKCILYGVYNVKPESAIIELKVKTKNFDKPVIFPLSLSDIHINTIERIACEVYNLLWNPEVDEDWEDVRQWYYEAYMQEFDR